MCDFGKLLLDKFLHLRIWFLKGSTDQPHEVVAILRVLFLALQRRANQRVENLIELQSPPTGTGLQCIKPRNAFPIHRLNAPGEHFERETILRPEMIIDRPEIGPCRLGDLADRSPLNSVL